MKKALKEKKVCVHADTYGACAKKGSKYKGLFCDAAKCKDFEEMAENAQRSTPNAQLSTEGGKHGHGVQEAGGGVPGGGGGGAVADARGVAPERGRELERGVREAGQEAEPGAEGDGVPGEGGVGVAGGGVRPGHAAGEADREPVGAGAVVRGGRGGVPLGGRGSEDGKLITNNEELIVPSRACAPARECEELPEVTADDVARCYLNAVCGVLHVVRFGCMMLVKETCLKFENGAKTDDPGYDGGLKKWLRDNVPDVNYKTAMGFKSTAARVCEVLCFQADVMLRAMNPDPKALTEEADGERLIAVRERLLEIIHGKNSLHAFRLWLSGGAPALNPADGKAAEDTGKADEIALDAARRFGRAASDALKCLDGRQRNAMTKALAKHLREALGLKGLAWLAKVLEEAES